MKMLLFALVFAFAFAEDELYNPFIHGDTLLKRYKIIRGANRRNERLILALEGRERKIRNTMDILYGDMKVAVDLGDRLKIEKQVEKLHKVLDAVRRQKRFIIRKMRSLADKVASPDRDRLVRETRIEHRIGLDDNIHIRRELEHNQRKILRETQFLAHKYAKMAAEIAANKHTNYINTKSKGNILKAKMKYRKIAKDTYNKTYKKIVERIEEATAEGIDNSDIKMVCRSAIDGLIRKLNHQYLTIVTSRQNAKKEVKKSIKIPMRQSMKVLSKINSKKVKKSISKIEKETKKSAKKVVAKKAKKALKGKKSSSKKAVKK